jgi:hypothetical protein
MATQSRIPCEAAIVIDDRDISEMSNSANFSCLQNISEGWTALTVQSIPSGET